MKKSEPADRHAFNSRRMLELDPGRTSDCGTLRGDLLVCGATRMVSPAHLRARIGIRHAVLTHALADGIRFFRCPAIPHLHHRAIPRARQQPAKFAANRRLEILWTSITALLFFGLATDGDAGVHGSASGARSPRRGDHRSRRAPVRLELPLSRPRWKVRPHRTATSSAMPAGILSGSIPPIRQPKTISWSRR